ncbi:MAG TPA: hypothetical protein DIT54_02135, partial [Lachnospiraceae bacterium]|nr:hypothetical protein [Lachnospiraceae bacterium]
NKEGKERLQIIKILQSLFCVIGKSSQTELSYNTKKHYVPTRRSWQIWLFFPNMRQYLPSVLLFFA